MDIKVDRQKWNSLKGVMGVSPRTQSHEKNVEIQRQVEKMLAAGVIRKSEANRYCQVLLVPKPDGKKRFCIDYTPLNSCCEGEGWNLPNIGQTLQRIGTHRPKYFAIMDFTSGCMGLFSLCCWCLEGGEDSGITGGASGEGQKSSYNSFR
jgi:hypothetical protein